VEAVPRIAAPNSERAAEGEHEREHLDAA